ncbi:MAG TPA: tRNA (adenosine(37)-N6)-threonylcarbamoyltransferase complex dimerization subunit type 1 TsaB, partial [Acidobacteriota bacterium]|nr:tRNA (adenosine(37)-N6)-threonylcarbamoyltransferase complex dimerization subunit type 1 TsaB [Acidobacteriota bacterium]
QADILPHIRPPDLAPLILSTDTSSRRGGVCLARAKQVVCELNVDVGLTFSEKLLEMIDFVLRLSGVELEHLDALAVTTGPGSFTGLRVGISTMKALAMRLRCPLIGVTALDCLAESAATSGWIATFMDARRHQVFAALYEKMAPGAPPRLVREGQVGAPDEWIRSLDQKQVKFLGDGTLPYRDLIASKGHTILESDLFLARVAIVVALRRLSAGNLPPADLLDAYYIRPSDAEIHRPARKSG